MDEEFYRNTNLIHNATDCKNDYCVESTLYIKVMGTIIFVLVWPFIVLDIKWLPLGRPAAALMGAALMVIFAVVPQDQVYAILGETGNIQTLFLLVGMMLMSYYYDREGILQYISLWIFGKNKPFKNVLWKVCMLSAVLSAIITNDATCLVLTPLLLAEHIKQGRPTAEYSPLLMGIATSANIGSSATFFGNPQNAFIAANSNGQVSLLVFLMTTLPAAIIGMILSVSLLYLCYFRVIWPKHQLLTQLPPEPKMNERVNGVIRVNSVGGEPKDQAQPMTNGLPRSENNPYNGVLSHSREELALSYDKSLNPYITSQIAEERSKMYSTSKDISTTNHHNNSFNNISSNKVSSAEEGTSSINESKSSSLEYGAIGKNYYENHIHNHITSGRVSRRELRSSDRFGSSMCMSECRPLGKEDSEESTLVEGETNSPNNSTDTTESSSNGRKWKKRIFVAWLIIITCIIIILLAIPPPPTISVGFNLGLIPLGGGILTMLVDTLVNRKYAFDAIMKVDWTMILMFMGLFIWLGGFENTLFPTSAFQFLRTHMDLYTIEGVLLFTIFVVVGSNILSNVPLVILIVDQLFSFKCGQNNFCTGQMIGVLLAGISTIAGNLTLVGSVANLIVAEKARNISNYRLGFLEYLKFGFCSTILVLTAGIPIMYFAGDRVRI